MKIKKSDRLSFINQYKKALDYIEESRNYIYFIAGLFLLSSIFGFVFSNYLGFIDKIIIGILERTEGLNTWQLILFILQNNLQSALFGLILGLLLGVFPLINALGNGAILGYVISRVSESNGLIEIWRLLPHGIFELPAIFISLGLGFRLGLFPFSKKKGELKKRFYSSINSFLFIVVPLLIIAAIIEGLLIAFLD